MNGDTSFLYVDDDPFSREVILIALNQVMKYEKVWVLEDSEDFMGRVGALGGIPDIILLDIHVTPLNGFEMLKLLRANPAYNRSRIIALTASVMNEEVAMLKESGFDGGIGKPVDPLVFPDLIHRIIVGETVWHVCS